MTLKYVGKSYPRHDVHDKVTGRTKYTGDIRMANMLYGRLITSTIAHGCIKSLDTSKALALEGVHSIYTYADCSDRRYNSNIWMDQIEIMEDEKLFTQDIKHYGDRIGVILAETPEVLEEAAHLIEIEYEKYEAKVSFENCLKEDNSEDVMFEKEVAFGNMAEEKGLSCTTYVKTTRSHHGAIENHVCLAYEDANGMLTIQTPCQVVFQVQLIVSRALNLPKSKIRVIKSTIGGSFGGKGTPILEPVTAYLTMAAGRPVMLEMTREQSICSTRTRNGVLSEVRTEVSKTGRILSREMKVDVDTGGYYTNGTTVFMAMAKKFFRLYRMNAGVFSGRVYKTHTPVAGAYRGYGGPQLHAVGELNMDMTARKLKMDPVELRLKNVMLAYEDDPVGGPNLGNAKAKECLIKGRDMFSWDEKYKRPLEYGRYRRGIGVACATHGNGYYGAYPDFITVSLRCDEDGYVFFNASLHDLGCGTVTTMQQIIAEVMDLPIERIRVSEGDTLLNGYDSTGTQASRVTYVCGNAALKAAHQLKEKMLGYAAQLYETPIEEIQWRDGSIHFHQTSKTLGQLASETYYKLKTDVSVSLTHHSEANPAVFCANFAEVQVDTFTGHVEVLDFVAVHDIGKAINPTFVEGQIQGSVQMGMGFGLLEEIEYDREGRVKTTNFSRYHVVNAPQMPKVRIGLIEDGEETAPFGAKSVGEIATVAVAPAIVNAVNHALQTEITTFPATPERILAALREQQSAVKGA